MSTSLGSTASAVKSWEKKARSSPLTAALGVAQHFALPLALAGWALRRYLAHRREAAAAKPKTDAKTAKAEEAEAATARKPRRDYKVKRDQEGPMLVGLGDDDVEIQPNDNVMQVRRLHGA
jgi:hypothetical protein